MSTTPTPLFRNDDEDASQPVSARIRSRLVRANQRYHANDNISSFLREGEVAFHGTVEACRADEETVKSYLGVGAGKKLLEMGSKL